ncbi:hypothetical protein CAPTEDRAFT_217302 [Capitella teleta]|uniref:Glycosyltransferase family 92 protein n=1 Tax=Capitella teleta TaxID=283909 RepID=R7T4G2_CAPTE|nr:hypothetical protein CAPTEDRAFT_217302 [Capitella teleta]|eukprot:ELT87907.1 hypothetical protein CAPTEDRAFT_217302 [Capitella teleta]
MECVRVQVLLVFMHCLAMGSQVCDSDNIQDCQEELTNRACPTASTKPRIDEEPQQWQTIKDRSVIVFSAYIDRRIIAGGPAVRIIASGLQEQFHEIGHLHCQLWFDHLNEAISVGPAEYIRIYPSTLHPDMWVSHFIMCPLPRYALSAPFAISITPGSCDETAENLLKVLDPTDEARDSNSFALCVSPVYNNFQDWLMVIEWFEIHKLIGSNEITIYNLSASPRTNKVLEFYAQSSDFQVNVVPWKFPPKLQSNVWCQRAALNDCLYRMGMKHSHVAITDLDEILVPRGYETWKDLIQGIDKPHRGAYLFQHAYFRRNHTSSEDPYLITQQSLWRTSEVTPPGKIRCKSMYKASKAIKIDLHFPYELIAGSEEYILPPAEGMLHHYRQEPMETFRKHPERFTFIEDEFMKKHEHALKERVNKVKLHIGL